MSEGNRIDAIREKIRYWMQEPVADEDGKYGRELHQNLRTHWPELFTDQPDRPVTNRDVMLIASLYLAEASRFDRDIDEDELLVERIAEFVETTTAELHSQHNKVDITEKNVRRLQVAMHALYRDDELSFVDTISHLATARLGGRILRAAEEVVMGGQSITSFVDSQPARAALQDALEHAAINFDHLKIRQAIEGSARKRGTGSDSDEE